MRSLLLAISLCVGLLRVHAQASDAKLVITNLTGDFYVYTTYSTYQDNKVPANGMYVVTNDGVAMFDTPWDTTQFQPLLDSIEARHHQKVTMAFATHFHDDKTAGLEYYRSKGIRTYTTILTDEYSRKRNMKRAEFLMARDTTFHIGPYAFEIYYPGPGHTEDNIIVWFPKQKILYGGCLIKGADAENLGNMGDANPKAYEATLLNVQKKCGNAKHIVIAHSDWRDRNSLKRSIYLAGKLKAAQ